MHRVCMKSRSRGTITTDTGPRNVGALTEAIVEQLRLKRRAAFREKRAALIEKIRHPAQALRAGNGGPASGECRAPAPLGAVGPGGVSVKRPRLARVAKGTGRGAETIEE